MPRTWTSPADLAGARPARGDEFPPEVAAAVSDLRARGGLAPTPEEADRQREQLHFSMAGVNRRGFLQLTGAAAVVAVVAGCGKKPHPDTLVAYNQQPEGVTLGVGVHYSTSVRVNGRSNPVVAKSYDGRPIKLEGNPDHPLVRGRSDAATQAAVLDLYDPDRGGLDPEQPGVYADGPRGPGGKSCTWNDLDSAVAAGLKSGRIGLITGPQDGPAELALRDQLVAAFGDRLVHAAYHPYAEDAAVEARRRLLGNASSPVYRLEQAQVLVSLGSDILGEGIVPQVAFGRFRRPNIAGGEMGQIIAFESTMSQLGTVADVRVRVAQDRLAWVAWAIAAEIAQELHVALPPAIAAALPGQKLDLRPVRSRDGDIPAVRFAAQRLLAARRASAASLVHVGGATHCGPESLDLHLAATWINTVLGNEGRSVVAGPVRASVAATRDLLRSDLAALIVAGADPVFNLPGAAEALARIPLVVSLNATRDETSQAAHWHAPGLHDLESWGDASLTPQGAEIRQPLILPLWNTRAAEESLMAFAVGALGDAAPAAFRVPRAAVPPQGGAASVVSRKPLWSAVEHGVRPWRDFVKELWVQRVQPVAGSATTGEAFWNAVLARGFVELPGASPANPGLRPVEISIPLAPAVTGLGLVCSAARTMGDGAALNNAWLQELPDPVSKICWDGYAAISTTDAKAAGISENDVIELTVGSRRVRLPAHVQEGQHPGCVEVFLGWGRQKAGAVAALTAEDGFRTNAFLLGERRWGLPVAIAKTGLTYALATTQAHHRMEGRPIALDQVLGLPKVEAEAAHWQNGTDGKPGGRLSIWRSHHTYPGHRWGMAIDLDACTGCGSCMVACSAENNVPVVGRDEVRKSRDMHWIRIDRYYLGEDDLDVAVTHQPMLCQHCDNAPCEAVCPANATVKSDEGVNIQVYNRCIGTRYCSNNCPYKVRRFNWYQYSSFRAGPKNSGDPLARLAKNAIVDGSDASPTELAHHPLNLLLNPEVTVRHRGVMEKCNFCVQRQREIRGGRSEVTSACAQACPTAAITFGDLNDPQAPVTKAGADPRANLVLDAEFNTRPKVAYLSKLRNRPATAADEERHG